MAIRPAPRAARGRRQRSVAADLQLPLSRTEEALRDQARLYLEQVPATQRARAAIEGGAVFDADLWRELAEMDWLGILIPEDSGGVGATMLEASILAEEMGKALLPGPFVATAVLAATALRAIRPDTLRELAAGRVRAALAPAGIVIASGGVATGRADAVLSADVADVLVLAAVDDDGADLLVMADSDAVGITRAVEASIDATRNVSTVVLDDAVVDVVARDDAARAAVGEATTAGAVVLAAELVGGARHCLELTVEHATNRIQFGKPIGSYQAVKHACVNVLIELEAARAAVRHAARLVDEADPDRHLVARVARVQAGRAIDRAAAVAIQLHGGAGFTWDNDAHLYMKRGKAVGSLLTARWHDIGSISRALGV